MFFNYLPKHLSERGHSKTERSGEIYVEGKPSIFSPRVNPWKRPRSPALHKSPAGVGADYSHGQRFARIATPPPPSLRLSQSPPSVMSHPAAALPRICPDVNPPELTCTQRCISARDFYTGEANVASSLWGFGDTEAPRSEGFGVTATAAPGCCAACGDPGSARRPRRRAFPPLASSPSRGERRSM